MVLSRIVGRLLVAADLSTCSIAYSSLNTYSLPAKITLVITNTTCSGYATLITHFDVLSSHVGSPMFVWADSMRLDVIVSYALICWASDHIWLLSILRIGWLIAM